VHAAGGPADALGAVALVHDAEHKVDGHGPGPERVCAANGVARGREGATEPLVRRGARWRGGVRAVVVVWVCAVAFFVFFFFFLITRWGRLPIACQPQ
jgi:hypothetical protein